jgi:hypothetical protein
MDHQEIQALGKRWQNVPAALGKLKGYAAFNGGSPGDGLKPEHFGGTDKAEGAAKTFLGLMNNLDKSVGTAQQYADSLAKALIASAEATSETEAENRVGLDKSGRGL